MRGPRDRSGSGLPPALVGDLLSGLVLVGAGANVVWQLSHPAVGHAVAAEPVPEGSLRRHPGRRTRTTLAYLAVCLVGTDAECRALGRAITAEHRRVRSAPGAPVPYDALDPGLQLWVAACLFQGALEVLAIVSPDPVPDAELDALYRHAARLATTLQVPAAAWPPDRADLARLVTQGLASARLDSVTRAYLRDVLDLTAFPWPLRACAPLSRALAATFLPPNLREDLGLHLSAAGERRLRRGLRQVARVHRHLPPALRALPFSWVLADLRRRLRAGRPLL